MVRRDWQALYRVSPVETRPAAGVLDLAPQPPLMHPKRRRARAPAHQLFHRGQDLVERERRERCGIVGYPIGNHELPAVHEATARVNDIGLVAVALVCIRFDQWFRQAANNLGRVVTIEQESADAVLSHGPHAVADYEPAGFGFDRRATIA